MGGEDPCQRRHTARARTVVRVVYTKLKSRTRAVAERGG